MHENNESFKDKKARVRKAAVAGDDFPYEKSDEPDLYEWYLWCIENSKNKNDPRIPADLKNSLKEKDFELIRYIDKGGQGDVYEAKHLLQGTPLSSCAIKILKNSNFDSCFAEVKKMDSIEGEYIVKLCPPFLINLDKKKMALVMELVDGHSLYDYIRDEEELTVRQILLIMKQICNGMKGAAEKKINHRDLKPSNILIRRSSNLRVVIIDFGLASDSNEKPLLAKPGLSIRAGTAHCVAPEQAQDPNAADEKSDIYGLGATMYYVVTGEIPFDELSEEKVWELKKGAKPIEEMANLREPSKLKPEVKGKLSDLIMKCLQTDPARRPETFEQVIAEIEDIEKDLQEKSARASHEKYKKAKTKKEQFKLWKERGNTDHLDTTGIAKQGERGKNSRGKKKRSAKRRQDAKSESHPSTVRPIEVEALNLDGREPIASPQKPLEGVTESSTQAPEAEGQKSLMKISRDYKKKGDLDTTIELCTIVLRKNKGNIEALLLRADTYIERDRNEK